MRHLSDRKLGSLLGISHTMVRKYRGRGMPSSSEDAALAWLAANSLGRFADEDRQDDSGEGDEQPERPAFAAVADLEGLSQADLTKRLTAARIKLTERDAAIARLKERQAQMDADLRDGKLLRAEIEHRKGFDRAIALRNKLIGLPAEWALQLAAMTDPAMIADFTRKRIKAALIEYCAAYGVTEPH